MIPCPDHDFMPRRHALPADPLRAGAEAATWRFQPPRPSDDLLLQGLNMWSGNGNGGAQVKHFRVSFSHPLYPNPHVASHRDTFPAMSPQTYPDPSIAWRQLPVLVSLACPMTPTTPIMQCTLLLYLRHRTIHHSLHATRCHIVLNVVVLCRHRD